MAPFLPPKVAIRGVKERIESLLVQGDRLYVGTALGNLNVYSIDEDHTDEEDISALVETKKNLTRRAIEQLGFVKDINSLVVLSESTVTLFPLPAFTPPTPLSKAKAAFSFAIHSVIQHIAPDGKILRPGSGDFDKVKPVPTLVTFLVVGCRRKLVIYSWKDGEAQDAKEVVLPHSPRFMAFYGDKAICLAYSPTEYALYSMENSSLTEITTPLSGVAAVTGASAFSGLSSYMTLGLGSKAKPCVAKISDEEVLIAKDNSGFFIAFDGKLARNSTVDWPAPPEELAYVKPYIFATLPPGSVPMPSDNSSTTVVSGPSFIQTPVIQIRSAISLSPVQTLPFPFEPSAPSPPSSTHIIRLMTSSPSSKSPLLLVTTPTDRNLAASEGSSIWLFRMKSWAEQVDELVEAGSYPEALALLDTIDQALLTDKDKRRALIRALNAVSQFQSAKYDDAINTFIDLEINPAKVVALYPDTVAGRLSVPREDWIPLFGGPAKKAEEAANVAIGASGSGSSKDDLHEGTTSAPQNLSPSETLERITAPLGSVRDKLRTGLDAIMPTGPKDDDTASIRSVKRRDKPEKPDDYRRSVETLLRYLSDRRPKVAGALATVNITPSQAPQLSPLSEASVEDLFTLPNASLSSLTPDQLLRFAQIVDTALFKSYLVIRPGLLGPLCRVENWCEVSEVEEVLRAREKFTELIYLYNGKKMHAKALNLLRQLSNKESDVTDKLMPSINYLQRLGPEYLDLIFESSRWIFAQDRDTAFQIFTSEEVELPRQRVADFLESIDPEICAHYLEYLIHERAEEDPTYHDRLAQVYLSMTVRSKKRGDQEKWKASYAKLLDFVDTTSHYRVDRLFGQLPTEDLFEARALLLGRLGRHEHALETYVYRLQDYLKAEGYCKRIYQPGTDTANIFLILLRIYLRPSARTSSNLLTPALELISRHSPRIDAVETLQLLPPLVTAEDVRTFLLEALRAPIFDTRVIRDVSKSRNEQIVRKLMRLETRRVRVTDSRICPQCHKRLGNSVIAVHSPGGEVTHYQCREAFSKKLIDTRH
ncbi:hypothetical protein JAAARDRAFT_58670 [Jaapia argillacea MUCL 33604]|uniref:CNH domain-containing protein n=1 Tax=Jaapia argillacea MUCL 33604 TaxID=933084 RepID=A0A067Q128_9AGAM|nr:hypothetical protein JAAARDRAFT_58670 [Jaapia argillacea MUCL 33604]